MFDIDGVWSSLLRAVIYPCIPPKAIDALHHQHAMLEMLRTQPVPRLWLSKTVLVEDGACQRPCLFFA